MSESPSPSVDASQIFGGAASPRMNAGWNPRGLGSEFSRYLLVGGFAFACDTLTLFTLRIRIPP